MKAQEFIMSSEFQKLDIENMIVLIVENFKDKGHGSIVDYYTKHINSALCGDGSFSQRSTSVY